MQIELPEFELRYAALRIADAGRAARMRASLAADGQQSPVSVIASIEASDTAMCSSMGTCACARRVRSRATWSKRCCCRSPKPTLHARFEA